MDSEGKETSKQVDFQTERRLVAFIKIVRVVTRNQKRRRRESSLAEL